ncbi:MAG: DNA polymerase III subunit delta [Acidobacteria bacterium]|nr:MAG: DNA polymerase III subunit delta [Acidobacteriota bacterium]
MEEKRPAAYLVQGSDSHLVSEAIDATRQELLGDRNPEMVVSEFEGENAIEEMLSAAWTPAFVDGQRILLARLTSISSSEGSAIADYLKQPSPDAVLLISAGGRLPRDLSAALKESGELISTAVPPPHKRGEWVAERARSVGLVLSRDASVYIAELLGDSVTAVGPFLRQLQVAYPGETNIGIDEVASAASGPRKGAAWDLTDSIDRGATESSLAYLSGAIAEGSHPLQLLALLHGHYRRLARVAGRDLSSGEAAKELGIKAFPAEKALAQASRLGVKGVRRAISLLAKADLDLKGASAQQPETVLELLVIRLCGLSGASARAVR